ncbi:hypothetical protein AB0M35_15330 [Micromonospora sp. NPDC051196]|uniref:hypothetical protein n=1 Tax=Micromonospora sp. NPDC051196 TaxID=3155281 RepID=UPI00343FCB70
MRLRVLAATVVVLPLLAACGDGSTSPTGGGRDLLANLPSCDRVPMDDPEVEADVPGLALPEGSRVTAVVQQGVLTTVEATLRMSPLDVRAHYEQRTDLDVLRVEDEVFETEVLARTEARRMYLRASALCADGSSLTVVVGPDSEDAGLPEFRSGG